MARRSATRMICSCNSALHSPAGRPVTLKFHAADFGRATVRPPDVYGLRVDYASVLTPSQPGESIPNGVVVREVEPGKPAKVKGLQEYSDFITAVNGSAVRTPADFYREAGRAVQAGESVRLNLRDGRIVTLP